MFPDNDWKPCCQIVGIGIRRIILNGGIKVVRFIGWQNCRIGLGYLILGSADGSLLTNFWPGIEYRYFYNRKTEWSVRIVVNDL